MDDVTKRIGELSPEKLALLMKRLRERDKGEMPALTIPRRESIDRFPMSFAQKRLWFLQQLDPRSSFYNIAAFIRIGGRLNMRLWEEALGLLYERHEMLRARYAIEHGEPTQQIVSPAGFPLIVIDRHDVPPEDRESTVRALAREEARKPFHLLHEAPARGTLIRLAEDDHLFMLSMHHIIADGWSINILVQELAATYRSLVAGMPPGLPPLQIQYADVASWQEQWIHGDAADQQLRFWKATLKGMPETIPLPMTKQRPPVQTFHGSLHHFKVPSDVVHRLHALAAEESATPFMVYLAAFQILLSRLSGEEDFGVSIPVAQRTLPETQGLVGFFVNTVIIRTRLAAHMTYRNVLRAVRESTLQAFAHQDLPFDRIVEAVTQKRDISHAPLSQVMFDYQRSPLRSVKLPGITLSTVQVDLETAKTDLLLILEEETDGLGGYFEYNTDLFDGENLQRVTDCLLALLGEIAAQPEKMVKELGLLRWEEKRRLLAAWNATAREYPRNTAVNRLIEAQVERAPDAVAVEFGDRRMTYRELNARANQLARFLQARGVRHETLVGVFVERSVDMVVAFLAILKAGGAYLPLDVDFPRDRIAFMAADANIPLILTNSRLAGRLLLDHVPAVCLDADSLGIDGLSRENLPAAADPDTIAYVIYTSGSTGMPKGVAVTHRNICRLVCNPDYITLAPGDRVAQVSTATFDAATFELWGTLVNGSCLVILSRNVVLSPKEFASRIGEDRITSLFLTTSLFNVLSGIQPEAFGTVRDLLTGGEVADTRAMAEVLARGRPQRLLNVYGPTEATTFASWYACPERLDLGTSVPIGKPIANTELFVLDAWLQPVPIGVLGELYIGGDGLARGYLQRPDLTAEKFIPHPFASRPGERLYRTGDVVRRLPDGDIEFLGRIDHQVKIRGFRIEPGEIEAVLNGHPDVEQAVVVVREDAPGDKRIVGYVVPRSLPAPRPADLKIFLEERLPQYMVPSAFVVLNALPLTASGKVDRRALPAPNAATGDKAQFEPPRTPLEKFLIGRWKEVLGIGRIGIHDNFFDLGGDSLKGAVLINRLQEEFGEAAHVSAIFLAPTVAELALYMTSYYPDVIKRRFGADTVDAVRQRPDTAGEGSERIEHATIESFSRLIPSLAPRQPGMITRRKNRRAVFVLSPPRSGSTLFRVMLAGHPKLFSPPELELLSFNTLAERKEALSRQYQIWLEATVRALMEAMQCSPDEASAVMADCERRDMTIKDFYGFLQERIGDRLLVDKTPSYALDPAVLRRAEEDFEEALYIHLLRHPYASIYSFLEAKLDENFFRYDHPFTRRELAELVWVVCHGNILDFLAAVPPHRRLQVKFEDLLQSPVDGMTKVCSFLGIEYDSRTIEPYKGRRMTDGTNAAGLMVGDYKFYFHKGIDTRSINRWETFHAEDFLGKPARQVAETLGYDLTPSGTHSREAAEGGLHKANSSRKKLTAIPRISRADALPLSFAQKRLWFLDQLEPGSALYNIPAAVRLHGALSVDVLVRSLRTIVERHESLRTTFPSTDGTPVQRVAATGHLALDHHDFSHVPAQDAEAETLRLINGEAQRPFDLAAGPLFRAMLCRLSDDDHILLVTMHHIIADGWSVGILIRELAKLYTAFVEGNASPLPPLEIQYADFAAWQIAWLEADVMQQQLAYWKQRLADAPPLLDLPLDHPRPEIQTVRGGRYHFRVPADLSNAFSRLGIEEGATPFMSYLSAFLVLLHRCTRETDICVGTPVANRTRSEVESLIGLFVNTVTLRVGLDGNMTFRSLLHHVRAVTQEAFDYHDVPFEKLVDALQPERNLRYTPLFQVMFAYNTSTLRAVAVPGLSIIPMTIEGTTSKFDLTLEVTEATEGLRCIFEYNADLFERESIARMGKHFVNILQVLAVSPDLALYRIPLLSDAERVELETRWSGNRAELAVPRTFPGLFEAQVSRTPDLPAVFCEGACLTYAELNARANRLARYLIRHCQAGPEKLIGIFMERSVEMVVAVVAVLKSGGAYVPLDPAYPRERLTMIIEDAHPATVLTHRALELTQEGQKQDDEGTRARLRNPLLRIDSPTVRDEISREDARNPAVSISADHLAYVIYTSGSTGRPKGVMVSHAAVVNLLAGLQECVYGPLFAGAFGEYGATRPLRLSVNAPLLFDASVQMLIMLVQGGHCLYVLPADIRADGEAMVDYIRKNRLDVLDCVPSQLKLMLDAGLLAEDAEWVPSMLLPGGEALDETTWLALRGHARMESFNMYGPTECTVDSTTARAKEHGLEYPVIGRPLANVRHYVLDPQLMPVPFGVKGELYIGGPGLARGYLGKPDQTAERFLPDPFSPVPGERMYRTGDLVALRADGHHAFYGRVDTQVKIRGFRIELGEIESVLCKHPAVKEAAAVVREQGMQGKGGGHLTLAAYFVRRVQPEGSVPEKSTPEPGNGTGTIQDIRRHLRKHLPDYMVPPFLIAVEALPKTPNGKLDRKRLPAPTEADSVEATAGAAGSGTGPEVPATPEEEILAGIWQEVLGLHSVSRNDNFFERGGDSILCIQVVTRARRRGLLITPKQMFQHPTVKALAAVAVPVVQRTADQGIVTGPVPLTPIQAHFFAREMRVPGHWNQGILLEVRRPIDPAHIRAVVGALLEHHDALRLRFRPLPAGWQGEIIPPDHEVPFETFDLALFDEESRRQEVERHASRIQSGLDITHGPVMRVAYFDMGRAAAHRLMLVFHHLVVDAVSWRILLEDMLTLLAQAEQGTPLQPPPKTTSYKEFAEHVARKVREGAYNAEVGFWSSISSQLPAFLPRDFAEGENLESTGEIVSRTLSEEETFLLLHQAAKAYGMQPQEVLLAATVRAVARWTGTRTLAVMLEGHGRGEFSDEGVDLARTVGWFTTLYPVFLDLRRATSPASELMAVKEQVRAIPGQGFGFSALRYLSEDRSARDTLSSAFEPEIAVNYLGQFDLFASGDQAFGVARESAGPERAPGGLRPHLLALSGRVLGGSLTLDLSFSNAIHRRTTMEMLMQWLADELHVLLEHCRTVESRSYTPSDFGEVSLSQQDVGNLLEELNEQQDGRTST